MSPTRDKPSRTSELLEADHVDLRVLAPAAYYSHFPVDDLERALDIGVRALGKREGVEMSFAFKRLDDRIRINAIPDDDRALIKWLERSLATSR